MDKAVVYCRVSTARQTRKGDGLTSQATRCHEFARYNSLEVVKVFQDSRSGSLIKRPGMQDILKFLRARRKQNYTVIIDDISRLARGIEAHLELRSTIDNTGATLASPSIEFGEDSDSVLVENLLASVSQHQRQKNAEQTRNRRKARMLGAIRCILPHLTTAMKLNRATGKCWGVTNRWPALLPKGWKAMPLAVLPSGRSLSAGLKASPPS